MLQLIVFGKKFSVMKRELSYIKVSSLQVINCSNTYLINLNKLVSL